MSALLIDDHAFVLSICCFVNIVISFFFVEQAILLDFLAILSYLMFLVVASKLSLTADKIFAADDGVDGSTVAWCIFLSNSVCT